MTVAFNQPEQSTAPYVPKFSVIPKFDCTTHVKLRRFDAADIKFRMVSKHVKHQACWGDSSCESLKISASPLDCSEPAIVKIENFSTLIRLTGKFLLSDAKYQYVMRASDSVIGPAIDLGPSPVPSASTAKADDLCWNAENDLLTITVNSPTEIRIPMPAPPGHATPPAPAHPLEWTCRERMESISFTIDHLFNS